MTTPSLPIQPARRADEGRQPSGASAARWVVVAAAIVAIAAAILPACLADRSNDATPRPSDPELDGEACDFPAEGCDCEDGQVTICGDVVDRDEDSVTCAMGSRTCQDGVWGACQADTVVERELPPESTGAYSALGLGQSQACANNPCNPYCNNYIDDYKGLDAGAPLKVTDAGLTLKPNEAPPKPQYTGLKVSPTTNNIVVTSIPKDKYPDTSPQQNGKIQFKAEYTPIQNPPAYTPAAWSLSDYDYALINGSGEVTITYPVPQKSLVVKANASSFSATATATVTVDALEANNIPANIVNQFAAGPPPPPPPVQATLWEDTFANNSKGWSGAGNVGTITYFSDDFAANNKGWSLGTEWQIGKATKSSGHVWGYADPNTDVTPTSDNGIAGVKIGGNATTSLHGPYYFTSPAVNTSSAGTLKISFYRWLNSDYPPFMTNTVEVYNGSSWVVIWSSAYPGPTDSGWVYQEFDVTPYKNANFRVRFSHRIESGGVYTVSSWNIDDFKIFGTSGNEWQIGPAKASSGHVYGNGDPSTDHTPTSDNGVAGVVIGGNIINHNPHDYDYLTSPVINTANAANPVKLEFWRWLNSDYTPYMNNVVEVYNGSSWVSIWSSGGPPGVLDSSWTLQSFDVSAYKNANFRVRFGFNIGSYGVFTVSSWNIDDVKVTQTSQPSGPVETTKVLYPYNGTVFPRSFTPPVLQWAATNPAAQYIKYCLRYYDAAQANKLTFRWCTIAPEPNPTRVSIPRWVWEPFETTAAGKTAEMTLQRLVNGVVLPEIVIPIKFSSEPMRGTIYFWEVNNGRVAKIDENGTLFPQALSSSACNACHSVSADGSRIVTQLNGGNGPGAVYDATGNHLFTRNQKVQFQAVNPNGTLVLWGENPATLSPITSTANLSSLAAAQSGRWVANPAWSPQGKYVAYASRVNSGWYVDYTTSDLAIAEFNAANNTFFNNKVIVTGKAGRPVITYPTFSPDDQYIIYQAANALRTRNNLGTLYMVKRDGTGDTLLTKANGNGYLDSYDLDVNYEPTFSPVSAGGYNWVVFVSNRTYGNTIPKCSGNQKDCGKKQLWVSAIDANPVPGSDPSHPAFWLAGQQTNNENMRGYFAKSPCKGIGAACKWNEDCCGYDPANPSKSTAKCVINQNPAPPPVTRSCKAFNPNSCVQPGDACAVDQDCCLFPDVFCIQGLCKSPAAVKYEPGTFVRDYEATCPAGHAVVWTLYQWKATTPGDSNIVISAQTADAVAQLAAAPKVSVATATNQGGNWNVTHVGSKLPNQVSKKYLRITSLLNPSSDGTLAPILSDWVQEYDCIPSE